MRFTLFVLFAVTLFAASSVDVKIKKTSKQLHSTSKNYKRLNHKMARTAEAILKQKRVIAKQEEQIAKLEAELKEKHLSYKSSKEQLSELQKELKRLQKESNEIEQKLTFAIAKSVTLGVMLSNEHQNIDSLVELEVLKAKLKNYKQKIQKYNKNFIQLSNTIATLNTQSQKLEATIQSIDQKRKKLLAMQKKNKEDLKKLKIAQNRYKKQLQRLLKKQDALKKTLARLNIIRLNKEKEAKERARRKAAFNQKITTKNLPKVKQYGKSYQRVKTTKYRGPKTFAPLKSYTITKKFGTYTDPIYGIKVFNESIALKPKKRQAQVRNVLNGKVIYADRSPMLNNIVIVEHKNGLHTIYANLSKISPYVKKGKKIKKGYVIGRVDDELIFEATQKSYHINPIQLFQ